MSADAERQPLLANPDVGEDAIIRDLRRLNRPYKRRISAWSVILLIFALHVISFSVVYVWRSMPSHEDFRDHVGNITTVEIQDVSFRGWTYIENERYYKMQVKTFVTLDYAAGSAVSQNQKRIIGFVGSKVVKEVCVDLRTLQTYQRENGTESVSLGTLKIPETVCVSLKNNALTNLDILVLVKPNTDQLIPILRKMWNEDYSNLNIWSSLDLQLRKRVLAHDFILWSVRNAVVYWKDFTFWDDILDALRHFSANIVNALDRIEINDVRVTEIKSGYDLRCSVSVPNEFSSFYRRLDSNPTVAPKMDWKATFPGCFRGDNITLDNVIISSPEVEWESLEHPFLNLTLNSKVVGNLPNEFLNRVCSSDDSNIITPMSKLVKQLLDPTNAVTLQVECCEVTESKPSKSLLDDYNVLVSALDIPLALNYTIDSNDIVKEVNTRGVKLGWSTDFIGRKRLNVQGKILVKVQLPFYQLKEETSFSMDRIKGFTKLFHNDVHMLTIPMDYWTQCSTAVILIADGPDKSYFEVSFDIDNDQVIIENTLEVSRCINEVIFKGESPVFINGRIDLMVTTTVGNIVLTDLPGEGSTVVRAQEPHDNQR